MLPPPRSRAASRFDVPVERQQRTNRARTAVAVGFPNCRRDTRRASRGSNESRSACAGELARSCDVSDLRSELCGALRFGILHLQPAFGPALNEVGRGSTFLAGGPFAFAQSRCPFGKLVIPTCLFGMPLRSALPTFALSRLVRSRLRVRDANPREPPVKF